MKLYKIKKSNIHRHGLSAAKDIKGGTKIIQYKGKKITNKESDENKKYGWDITYLFTLNKKYLLDGDFKYNTARLVNHSCNPNCEVLDNNGSEIWISAIQNINKNEDINMLKIEIYELKNNNFQYDFQQEKICDFSRFFQKFWSDHRSVKK